MLTLAGLVHIIILSSIAGQQLDNEIELFQETPICQTKYRYKERLRKFFSIYINLHKLSHPELCRLT